MPTLPRYPVYVPSKGRYTSALTIKFLQQDECPCFIVVEPQEERAYGSRFGFDNLLVLPWSGDDDTRRAFCSERGIENGGLIAVRNWIKEHSIAAGHARHWQLDDNIRKIRRRYADGRRIPCDAGVALAVVEDFADRYTNVALAGLNYGMFLAPGENAPPFHLNCRVYSCTLIDNAIPHRWRLAYNDDTDICLQVLADGLCTVLVNAFMIDKTRTMVIKGGNTTDLYQGDGRLKMARALERMWPGVVETDRRFNRPQHVVKDAWRRFDTPLILKEGIDLAALQPNEYGMELHQVREIKAVALQNLMRERLERGADEGSDST